ncbi:MAG: MMPL family transporter, partial [Polynucleobacter sp.]|nr:MMPL family transporter [Polynucleobacter sp.]
DYTSAAMEWEKSFLDTVKQFADDHSGQFKVAYMAERSIEDELQREQSSDIPIIIVSYAAMFIYISVSLGPIHPLRHRVLLAFAGVLVVAASIVFSVGMLALIGVKASLFISEVIPFLTLAIGVDNMFLIVSRVDGCRGDMSAALAGVGGSVTLASLCEALAFFLGALTDMPAIRALCLFAGTAVLADWILQLTVFAACIHLSWLPRSENPPSKAIRGINIGLYIIMS